MRIALSSHCRIAYIYHFSRGRRYFIVTQQNLRYEGIGEHEIGIC